MKRGLYITAVDHDSLAATGYVGHRQNHLASAIHTARQ
jgi:hypothetical protein